MTTEFGVRSAYSNGTTQVHPVGSLAAAVSVVERQQAGSGVWNPVAEAVMVRECSDWVELRSDEVSDAAEPSLNRTVPRASWQ